MAENEIRIKDLPSTQQINETDDVIVLDNATDGTRKLQGKVLLDMIHSAMAKGTASGAIATFTDGADGIPMTDLVVSIEPQQSGSGDPSPENVRPISGWTACNVVRTGENLIDITSLTPSYAFNGISYTINSDGSVTVNGTATARSQVYWSIPQNVAKTFANKKLNGGTSQSDCSLFLELNASPYTTYATDTGLGSTISTDIASATNDVNLVFRIAQGTTLSNLTIRPTIANASNTYTINFVDGSNPLTVYGGTLDVLSGVLTVDRGYADLGTLTWEKRETQVSGEYRFFSESLTSLIKAVSTVISIAPLICSKYVANSFYYVDKGQSGIYNHPNGSIGIKDNLYNLYTADQFKTAMNGVQLVYELATPQTYQLTPTEVKSLLGVNNIYADTGNILNAEYVRDTTTIINQILARLDALES